MITTLKVRIISPLQLILATEAEAVSSKNSAGKFDILPEHANFITLVENSPIIIRLKDQKRLVFKFPLAIVLTINNKVNIYTYLEAKLPEKFNS